MHKGIRNLNTKEIVESILLFGLFGIAVILGMCL